jgi:hypothetical protein
VRPRVLRIASSRFPHSIRHPPSSTRHPPSILRHPPPSSIRSSKTQTDNRDREPKPRPRAHPPSESDPPRNSKSPQSIRYDTALPLHSTLHLPPSTFDVQFPGSSDDSGRFVWRFSFRSAGGWGGVGSDSHDATTPTRDRTIRLVVGGWVLVLGCGCGLWFGFLNPFFAVGSLFLYEGLGPCWVLGFGQFRYKKVEPPHPRLFIEIWVFASWFTRVKRSRSLRSRKTFG